MQSTAPKWTAEENRRSLEHCGRQQPQPEDLPSHAEAVHADTAKANGGWPWPTRKGVGRLAARAREERLFSICEGMTDLAAAMFNVSGRALRHPGRSSIAVSRVRQVAMYVAHVGLGLSMREVGRGFSRDRTTVLYACHLIEDLRDDDEFDCMVAMFERVAKLAFGNVA